MIKEFAPRVHRMQPVFESFYTYIYKFMGFITVPSCKKTDMDFCEKKVSVVRMNRIVSKILNSKKNYTPNPLVSCTSRY